MLWYKAWRETQTRFLISALAIAVLCLVIVVLQQPIRMHSAALPGFRASSYEEHIYKFIYSGMGKSVFILILFFLGLGGLKWEQAHGTAGFTLALPVSRKGLVLVRIAVGLAQVGALALLPALIIPTVSLAVQQHYPLTQGLHFSVLWITCGMVPYALALLFSTILGGEYTALLAAFVAFFLQDTIVSVGPLQHYRVKLLHIMGEFGTMQWNAQHTVLSAGPLPWSQLAAFSLAGLGMLLASLRIAQKQDF